jgi:Co/Zn/Cd efflux system component
VNDLRREIADLSGVKELIDLKVWSTNRKKHYGAVRVRVEEGYGSWRVKQLLRLKGVESYV